MVEYTTRHMPRWYPISISGYHIAEAGATPVQQAAYTLSNGFTYVELFRQRGLNVEEFGPRLSFFLDCGLDVEYVALARVCRKIWAIGMRDVLRAGARAQRFKLHTQTSGRSLISRDFKNNLTRTAIEMMLACINATNSCHSNSADEPFTTPAEEYVRLAAQGQAILLEESGLFKGMMNLLSGSRECAPWKPPSPRQSWRNSARSTTWARAGRGGAPLSAQPDPVRRPPLRAADPPGQAPIIGLNRYRGDSAASPDVQIVRTPPSRKQLQVDRLKRFKRRHARQAGPALDALAKVVESGGNVFAQLIDTVEHCSLARSRPAPGSGGKYRPTV